MASYESTRSIASVVFGKRLSATASAVNQRICLGWKAKIVAASVYQSVFGYTWNNFKIIWPVVLFVFILVMDNFSRLQQSAEFLFSSQAMFVGITSDIRQVMRDTDFDKDVAVRRDYAATLPIRIA